MKKITAFILCVCISFAFMSFTSTSDPVVMSKGLDYSGSTVQTVTDLTDLIKLVLSTVGGIIATIILAFLRKRFPDYFGPALEAAKEKLKKDKKP